MTVSSSPLAAVTALTQKLVSKQKPAWPTPLQGRWESALPAVQLFNPGNPLLKNLLDQYARQRNTDRRIAASQVWKLYCYHLVLPAVAGWVAHRRVVDVAAQNVVLDARTHAPDIRFALFEPRIALLSDDPAATHAHSVVAGNEAQLMEFLLHRVLDDHLIPALTAFRECSGIGNRILWGSVAVAFTAPFGPLTRLLQRNLRSELIMVLRELGPVGRLVEIADIVQLDAGPHGQRTPRPLRRTCCQKMRIPGATNCTNCPLLSAERRAELSAAKGIVWIGPPTRYSQVASEAVAG